VRTPAAHEGPTSRRDGTSLGLEDRVAPWRGRLIVNAALRRERANDDFPAGPAYAGALMRPAMQRHFEYTNASAGARIAFAGGVSVRANVARAERLPSLFELYGNRGTVVGNRGLLPERLDHRDAGLAWESAGNGGRRRASAEVAVYRSDARDLIVVVQNSQYASVAQNVSAARLEGVEVAGSMRAGGFALSANWTHQETRDQSEVPFWRGRQLPGRPEDEASTRAEWSARRWGAFHEFHFSSGNFLDRANRLAVDARQIHDLGLHAAIAGARLTAEVRNVGDDQVRDAAAYPLPGRTWALTAEIRL
jgi:outer membrane receptor protein involved in Fe transport